jgi:three-Cys-motif partner protein
MVNHDFGGPWTELKLDAVVYYLECYTKALKRAGFDLTYIDAFAGTGSRDVEREVGGILEGVPLTMVKETLDGSARRALAVQPPFDHLIFIEKRAARCAALSELANQQPSRDIEVVPGEANQVLRDLVKQQPRVRKDKCNSRGVVFLDPYALEVEWKTLQALASTLVFDVWYLFPIRDTIRQLAHNFQGIGLKQPMLDRLLGPEWRVVSTQQFEQWLKRRLLNEFEFVSDPLPILKTPTRQLFSLFLGVSNPSRPAIELAEKFVRHVNKKFGSAASRRKSGRGGFGHWLFCSSHPTA